MGDTRRLVKDVALPEETDPLMRETLANSISALSPTRQAILFFVYWKGLTIASTARQIGKSEQHTSYLHMSSLRRLRHPNIIRKFSEWLT